MLYGWFISVFLGFLLDMPCKYAKIIYTSQIFTHFLKKKNATFPRIDPILKGYILQY